MIAVTATNPIPVLWIGWWIAGSLGLIGWLGYLQGTHRQHWPSCTIQRPSTLSGTLAVAVSAPSSVKGS